MFIEFIINSSAEPTLVNTSEIKRVSIRTKTTSIIGFCGSEDDYIVVRHSYRDVIGMLATMLSKGSVIVFEPNKPKSDDNTTG